MRKKTRQSIKLQASAMAGVMGSEKLIPYMLRALLHGYYLGCGHTVSRASAKAEKVAKQIEGE